MVFEHGKSCDISPPQVIAQVIVLLVTQYPWLLKRWPAAHGYSKILPTHYISML